MKALNINDQKKDYSIAPVIKVVNVEMHVLTMQETVEIICERIEDKIFTQHAVINVAKFVNMQSNEALRHAVNACDIVNIDGMGLVWGARLLGNNVSERVAGIDLFTKLLLTAEKRNYPVYFLGAKENVLLDMVERVLEKYPDLQIAGHHHGYFCGNEKAIVEEIAASGAYLLFVAISSPKKEVFINHWGDKLGVHFVMGVGGSFDVLAGRKNRAPLILQKIGLEWFFRFCQEPHRMWKRYLVSNTKYIWIILKNIFPFKNYYKE